MKATSYGNWIKNDRERQDDFEALIQEFHYPRKAVEYMMDGFPIVNRRDTVKYGEYRTKNVILEIYEKILKAMTSGQAYETRLVPSPADPICRHKSR
jgi:hypothetical protein